MTSVSGVVDIDTYRAARRPVCHHADCTVCRPEPAPWHPSRDSAHHTRAHLRGLHLWGRWQGACIGLDDEDDAS